MENKQSSISRHQAAHEAAAGRGFLLWIAAYLVLTLAFLVFDHAGSYRTLASHGPDKPTATNRVLSDPAPFVSNHSQPHARRS